MKARLSFVFLLCLFCTNAWCDYPSNVSAEIDLWLQNAQKQNKFAGLSVAVVDASGHVWSKHYGYRNVESKLPPNNHTIYELGSVSKTFTRLLLALESDVNLQDPISKYLPSGVRSPRPGGQEIRIQDLALHTGFRFAIPCVVLNDQTKCFGVDPSPSSPDPYAGTTRQLLFQYVDAYTDMVQQYPQQFVAPGKLYEYSNAGMGLLGELLALRHQTTYSVLLKRQILGALHLHDTQIEMPCEAAGTCKNLADVYRRSPDDSKWTQSTRWHLPGLEGAGGIRSSLADMVRYLKFEMGLAHNLPSKLQQALQLSQTEMKSAEADLATSICPAGAPPGQPCNRKVDPQFFGWVSEKGVPILFHGGETGSSESIVLFTQDHHFGVVILTNSIPGINYQAPEHFPSTASLCIGQIAGQIKMPGIDLCATK